MKPFHAYHPAVLFFYFTSIILLTGFCANPVISLLALIGAVCYSAFFKKPSSFFGGLFFGALIIILSGAVNPLFSHNGVTVFFFLNGNPITMEALLYGLQIGVMLAATIGWFGGLNNALTTEKLLYLFGRVAPKLALLLSSTLRFIPLLGRQAQRIRSAAKGVGLFSADSAAEKLRSSSKVYLSLVGWSLENAVATGNAMKARGYGLKGRGRYSLYKFSLSDGAMLIFIFLLIAAMIPAFLRGMDFVFYPVLTPPKGELWTVLAYISFGILTIIPFIFDAKERLLWKFYVLKI